MPPAGPDLPLRDRIADRCADLSLRVRRAVLSRRRSLAFVCAVVAVLAGLHATTPTRPATVAVLVAARDLPAGTTLAPTDLRVAGFAPGTAPDHRIRDPVGRVVAAPMRRGEPVTDTRVVGAALTAGRPDLVTVPVRLPDPAMAALLRVGDRIDVLAADPQGGVAEELAHGCVVVALPAGAPAAEVTADGQTGRLVVLGVPSSAVTAVSGASVSRFLTFTFSH